MLIGLTGKARSGKDTAAQYLVQELGFYHYWFSKPMKDALATMFGWTDDHLYGDLKEVVDERFGISPRVALQTLGTEWGRQCVSESVWLDVAQYHIEGRHNVVVSDVRFDNEAEFIRSNGGIVIEVIRDNLQEVAAHSSERGINSSLIDMTIDNDGTIEDLHRLMAHIFAERYDD